MGFGSSISILNGECIDNNIFGSHFVRNVTIDNLMTPYTKSWNETVVRPIFSANLASNILNTLLINQVQSDRLLWKVEKNGRYSVCSVYRLCVEDLINSFHLHRWGFGLEYESSRFLLDGRI